MLFYWKIPTGFHASKHSKLLRLGTAAAWRLREPAEGFSKKCWGCFHSDFSAAFISTQKPCFYPTCPSVSNFPSLSWGTFLEVYLSHLSSFNSQKYCCEGLNKGPIGSSYTCLFTSGWYYLIRVRRGGLARKVCHWWWALRFQKPCQALLPVGKDIKISDTDTSFCRPPFSPPWWLMG